MCNTDTLCANCSVQDGFAASNRTISTKHKRQVLIVQTLKTLHTTKCNSDESPWHSKHNCILPVSSQPVQDSNTKRLSRDFKEMISYNFYCTIYCRRCFCSADQSSQTDPTMCWSTVRTKTSTVVRMTQMVDDEGCCGSCSSPLDTLARSAFECAG